METRILKITSPVGMVWYAIQRKRKLFKWTWWADVPCDQFSSNSYTTLEAAKLQQKWYDGTPWKKEIVE